MTIWTPTISEQRGPIYTAIADALAEDIAAGRLKAQAKLPTHRDLAYRLGVTTGTITRAYAEAERRGLVYGEVGRGTFVRAAAHIDPYFRTGVDEDAIDLTINFSVGQERDDALRRTLAELAQSPNLSRLLDYHPHRGLPAHRAAAAQWCNRHGMSVHEDQVIITAGGQHAMMTVFSALARPGDTVLTEHVTYAGMKALAHHLQLRLHGVAMDEHGITPEAFAHACRATHAKLIYLQPTVQNPTGRVMPEARRHEIVAIARSHGVMLVEDDVYGFLPERVPPQLQRLAPDITIYLTTASKCMAPGLRVGYLIAPPHLAERLAQPVRATVWMAAPMMAEIACQWMRDGTVDRVVDELRAEAKIRQAMAAQQLGVNRPPDIDGHFLMWFDMPRGWRAGEFVDEARRHGVVILAADAFAVEPQPPGESIRLCLGAPRQRATLEKGLGILRNLLDDPRPALSVV